MAGKILGNILPLSLSMGEWFLSNSCAVFPGVSAMGICVVDADSNRVAGADRTADLMRTKLS